MHFHRRMLRRSFYRGLAALGQNKLLQRIASRFWAGESDSFIAPPLYYDIRETALRKLLGSISPIHSAIDIGCGNGRFTRVLGAFADRVDAFDISSGLSKRRS